MFNSKSIFLLLLTTFLTSPSHSWAAKKEAVVLMPLQVSGADKTYRASMETALVKGMQGKWRVYAGARVQKKVREIFERESKRAVGKDCDETRCMQDIAIAFQTELIATSTVVKNDSGYLLTLSVRNIFDDIVIYSESRPCRDCDEMKVVDKMKDLPYTEEEIAARGRSRSLSKMTAASRAAIAKEEAEIAKREAEVAALDEKIAGMKGRLGSGRAKKGDSLDDMLTLVRKKEAEAKQKAAELEKLKIEASQQRKKAVEADIKKYEEIANSEYGASLKETAWASLVQKYPEGKGAALGDVRAFKEALGLKGGGTTSEGMVIVKGGCFQMGDTFGDGDSDEKPVHKVCVEDFEMDKTEVTQAAYEWETGKNPASFKGAHNPVENVNWNEANAYCEKVGKRLPTEAEWEYAAMSGGKKEKYSGGNDLASVGWYKDNSGAKTHPVGQKQANGLGIYDMSGNVWEWVNDWYDEAYYKKSPENNPGGASSGKSRVFRGGSWSNLTWYTRSSNRSRRSPAKRYNYVGFRCARLL